MPGFSNLGSSRLSGMAVSRCAPSEKLKMKKTDGNFVFN